MTRDISVEPESHTARTAETGAPVSWAAIAGGAVAAAALTLVLVAFGADLVSRLSRHGAVAASLHRHFRSAQEFIW